ncbi:MAG: alanine racemase [Methylococcaceae bacterium]
MIPAAYVMLSLDALKHNLAQVRASAPQAKVMAVIKANAYGHGLLRVAHALNTVDAFAVARLAEGIRLREANMRQRIAVLSGFTCPEELDLLLDYQLDVVVHSHEQLSYLKQRTETSQLAVWLKLDTGMNRLGFKAAEFDEVYQRLRQCTIVKQPINIMTHLANADDSNDDSTSEQIALFKQTTANIQETGVEYSIANSAGLLAHPQALSHWVRPGIMLYGISPFANSTGEQLGLKPVMSLRSRLIVVKPLAAGEKVGYAGTWQCQKDTLLGVVAVGYGDGYPRHAREGTPVLINGQRVPLCGRVSMDMITVDLASLPDAKVGDLVTLWGEGLPVEEIALCADTIPYTLVCAVTQRVHFIEAK